MGNSRKSIYVKGLIFYGIFMSLYFAYKYIPWPPLKIICGITESNFQHYKAVYFSWIILSFCEYAYVRKKLNGIASFVYSRMATATILPWFVFLLWYIGPAIYGKMPKITLEILYANIITIITGIFGSIFEQGLFKIDYSRELKVIILILFAVSLMHYMVFTFIGLPWADVFVEPDYR